MQKKWFSQKLSNLELWSLLTTYRKSYMGFSKGYHVTSWTARSWTVWSWKIMDCLILDHCKVYPWKQNIDHEQLLFNVEMFMLKSRSKKTLWYRPCSPIYVYFCNDLFAINNFLSCSQQCNCSRLQQCFSCHAVQILLFCQCLSDCNMKIITVEQKQVQ